MSERDDNKRPVGSHERQGIKAEMEVPVNLERVLLEAAQDPAFYRSLLEDRARALAEKGYHLRASEQAMLSVMPRVALDKMVERLRPDKLTTSTFAKHVVAALAGSLIVSTSACDPESTPAGITPNWPPDGGGGVSGDVSQGGSGGTITYSPTGGVAPNWTGGSGGASGGGGRVTGIGGAATKGIGPDWPAGAGGKSGSGGQSGTAGTGGEGGVSGSSGVGGSSGKGGASGVSGAGAAGGGK